MLKKINESRVESDNGFFIHITGLENMRYQENDQYIDFTWSYDPQKRKTFFYIADALNWDYPVGKHINEQERKKIINNIREALKLLTGDFEII